MNNFIQDGHTVAMAAPYAVESGEGALIGAFFGVAAAKIANGAVGEFRRTGVINLKALSTDVASGTTPVKIYWDNTNKRATVSASGNTLIGVNTRAKINGDTTVWVLLDGTAK